jgi:hypothetical protein
VLLVRGRPITLGDGFTLRSLRHRANPYAWFDVGELQPGSRQPGCDALRAAAALLEPRASACSGTHSRWARGGYEQLVRERICRPLALEDTGSAGRSRTGTCPRWRHAPRWQRRGGLAVGLGWTRLTPSGSDHELLFHNGGTGGFRSFTGLRGGHRHRPGRAFEFGTLGGLTRLCMLERIGAP